MRLRGAGKHGSGVTANAAMSTTPPRRRGTRILHLG
jgi:hypothetical protein